MFNYHKLQTCGRGGLQYLKERSFKDTKFDRTKCRTFFGTFPAVPKGNNRAAEW